MITVPYNFIPRDYQLKFFQWMDNRKVAGKRRRAIKRWHRRAGKDTSDYCYMVKEAYITPGNYYYIFPTSEDARRALWEKVDKTGFRTLYHCPEGIAKFSHTEMKITIDCFNGKGQSFIRVIGFDKNPDSIRGISCAGAVVSEDAFSDPEVLKILMPAIKESNGWLIVNSTPNGKNHFYDLWMGVQDDDNWFKSELQTLWPDRPNYSGLFSLEEIQEDVNAGIVEPDDVEREYGVSFESSKKGTIYAAQLADAQLSERIGTIGYIKNKTVSTLWDIGANDQTSVWFFQNNGNFIDFISFFEGKGLGTDALAQMLLDKGYKYNQHILPHDAGQKKQGREVKSFSDYFEDSLRDLGVSGRVLVLPRTTDKKMSILGTKERFPCYRFDSIECAEGLHHIGEYHRQYNKRTKMYSDEPMHDEHSNAADALRMEHESQLLRNDTFAYGGFVPQSSDTWEMWE